MNKLNNIWIKFTKEREIEEFNKDVQNLYNYTIHMQQEIERLNNIIDELIIKLTPDYENYKKLIDKRDIIDSLTESYWLGVAETSEYVLDKLKGGE